MDRLHAEPRSDDPEVNAIGRLPRSEVEAILRDVDHPLHAAAVEHRWLLNLALRPIVERVSEVVSGFMRSSPAAAEMTRSIGIALKHLAVAAQLNASVALPGVEAVRRGLAAMTPVLDTLSQQVAADPMWSTRLAQRNAALTTKMAAMRPPPGISGARLGGSVRDPFGLTRPAPDSLAGLAGLVAQAPRGPSAARPVAAGGTAAAGQAEMNRLLAAIVEFLDEQRADGPRNRASEVRMEFVAWAALLVAVVTMLMGVRAPAEVEPSINVFVVEWQALDHLSSQTPADGPSPLPAACLEEPPFPVPLKVPECVPRSWCAH
jgi:hypothetical protein